jgi:Protein of unknown function (DUF3703)
MSSFTQTIDPYIVQELQQAERLWNAGQRDGAFGHLERAHILGQTSTWQHLRTHWHMLVWGVRSKSIRECVGQVTRIIGAAVVTPLGQVPVGNTGGSNISPFKPLPVPQDLAAMIASARQQSS